MDDRREIDFDKRGIDIVAVIVALRWRCKFRQGVADLMRPLWAAKPSAPIRTANSEDLERRPQREASLCVHHRGRNPAVSHSRQLVALRRICLGKSVIDDDRLP
jgi:hypothetical protein